MFEYIMLYPDLEIDEMITLIVVVSIYKCAARSLAKYL